MLRDGVLTLALEAQLVTGADLPEGQRVARPARQQIAMGETYDYEFTPARPGNLRIEVRGGGGRLMARVPVRVR